MIPTFHHEDPQLLWVNAEAPDTGCTGAFENPFSTPEAALNRVKPGQTIVLTAGEYVGDCNIQISGTPRNPISICAEKPGTVIIKKACWFFYDTSDLIVSNLSFVDAPFGALSQIGSCSRNRFASLRFTNCSNRHETGCTFYLGGAGGGCNVVEECVFEATNPADSNRPATVALMLAQGDPEQGTGVLNNLVRRNTITNYDYGIIAGSDDARPVRCGHIIEYNTIGNCRRQGILVRSGDTTIRGNCLSQTTDRAITIQSPLDCTVEHNRICSAGTGISLSGNGHTVTNNCLIHSVSAGITIGCSNSAVTGPAQNIFVEHNTLINNPDRPLPEASIHIASGTSGILQNNLFAGGSRPYGIVSSNTPEPTAATHFIIKDNGSTTPYVPAEGVSCTELTFSDPPHGDYSSNSSFGATGWVVKPEGFDPHQDEHQTDETDYRSAGLIDVNENTATIPGEDDVEDPFTRLFTTGTMDNTTSTPEDESSYWYPDTDE